LDWGGDAIPEVRASNAKELQPVVELI